MTRIVLWNSLLLVLLSASALSQVLYSLESPFEEQNGFFGKSVSSTGNVNSDWYDGDPDWNWTYLVVAFDMTETGLLGISNRAGEQNFGYDIP